MGAFVTPPSPGAPPGRGRAQVVFAVVVGVWTVAVTVLAQAVVWAIEQFLIAEGLGLPPWGWPVAAWVNAVLVAGPAVVLALAATRRGVRAAGRTWTLAAGVLGVLGSVRAIPPIHNDAYLAVLAAVAGLLAWALRIARRTRSGPPRATDPAAGGPVRAGGPVTAGGPAPDDAGANAPAGPPVPLRAARAGDRGTVLAGAAAGLAVLLPWLWVGALGGPLETLLAGVAAFAVAVLVADLLGSRVTDGPLAVPGPYLGDPRARSVLLAGVVGGVALVPVAAGAAGSGPHLALMLFTPALGFAAAALARGTRAGGRLRGRSRGRSRDRGRGRGRGGIVALLAPALFGPLAFVEPAETSILVGLHDVGYWTAVGALASLGIALVVGAVALVARRGAPRRAAPAALAAAVVAVAVVYPVAGHPGFFGERLFVVMKRQADLAGLDAIADRDTRRVTTYRRLVDTAEATQAPLRAALRRWHLGFTPYYLVNGIEVDGGPAVRAWLSTRDDVDRVLVNPRLRPIPALGPPIRGTSAAPAGVGWNVAMIGADKVWTSGDTGTGIVIGSSDSGVDGTHPALAGSFRGGGDSWYDPWNGSATPVDHNGHGTHTLGSALGADGIGVAPGATWMGCVNLDRNMANPAYYLDCLQFMLAPFTPGGDAFHGDPARAADVLTNSWGCPPQEGCDGRALAPAVDALTAAGIFFVAAAGNEGPRCASIDDAPAPYAATFTVAAVDRDGSVATFSSRGPVAGTLKPDLAAPGVDVTSALPGGEYGELSGTSMATPQVAGVVALMWSANPALRGDIARTAAILRATATPAAPAHGIAVGCGTTAQTGSGIVDAEAAVTAARMYR